MGYLAANSVDQALKALQEGDVAVIAGCTDWYPGAGSGAQTTNLLNINNIPEFGQISKADDGWRFGAAVRWSDVLSAPLPPAFNGLKQAASKVGSVQIQNVATLVGNICNASPAADGVPPLLALNAKVELISSKGTRSLELAEFITGVRQTALQADELVSAVIIPDQPETARGSFVKLGSREYLVISIAMVSAVVTLDDQGRVSGCRVAVGACSPVAQRLKRLEEATIGNSIAEISTTGFFPASLFADLSPISDIRGGAGYRLDVVASLCQRAIGLAVGPGGEDG